MGKRTGAEGADNNQTYDMPNMEAVARETRRLDDPRADYPLAVQMRDAQLSGAFSRRSR